MIKTCPFCSSSLGSSDLGYDFACLNHKCIRPLRIPRFNICIDESWFIYIFSIENNKSYWIKSLFDVNTTTLFTDNLYTLFQINKFIPLNLNDSINHSKQIFLQLMKLNIIQ